MSQKRIIASLLMVFLAFSLAACGMGKPAPSLPPLTKELFPSSSEAEAQAPRATRIPLYEEVLPNGLKITVFDRWSSAAGERNIEENLKTRNIFSDYVPNITTLKLRDGVEVVGEKHFKGGTSFRENNYRRLGKRNWVFRFFRMHRINRRDVQEKCRNHSGLCIHRMYSP